MDGGAWVQSWLLTGLPEPIAKKKFAAPPDQVAVISNYVKQMAELRKNLPNDPHAASSSSHADGAKKD